MFFIWETLKKNNVFIFNLNFYDFENSTLRPEELPLEGYKQVEKIKTPKEYTRSDDFVCFLAKDGFFYSAEFAALILSWHVIREDLQKEEELTKRIAQDINRL